MKPLCCVVYVFGKYTEYIPFYIYSILKSYPDYYVKVFVQQSLSKKESVCLQLIKNNLSDHFIVKENYFNNIRLLPRKKMVKAYKALRWLIPYDELKEFENVYIGDVDFLIVAEKPSLLEGHLKHCSKIGLPYSNRIRSGDRRLTGLHFIKVKDYYEKMNEIIEFFLCHIERLKEILKHFTSNEEFLYHIVKKGIGLGMIKTYTYRPLHGFHLGWLRGDNKESTGYFDPERVNSQRVEYYTLKSKLKAYFEDPLFIKILKILPNREVIRLFKLVGD